MDFCPFKASNTLPKSVVMLSACESPHMSPDSDGALCHFVASVGLSQHKALALAP